jgi:hypothetical protein
MVGLQKGRCDFGPARTAGVFSWWGWDERAGMGVLGVMATKKKAAKKSSGEGQACWPGFKRVPGTEAGAKGSCEPKAKQTAAEKQADSRAAAAVRRGRRG